ncbi:atrial natriuretic peptide receptor 1-like isoform X2 [Lineus longissimus]|uniref:atrial natriuretic peptide receptor 1-like isoform X2 n=1 Tax=Lineus longissimus TaxID=88925 RepID=UPI002B4DBC20
MKRTKNIPEDTTMAKLRRLYLFGLILMLASPLGAWHNPFESNLDYHCWPIEASASDPTPYGSCPGVTFEWITAPPSSIKQYLVFNVTYRLVLDSAFYSWAVGLGRFVDQATGLNQTTAANAESWCVSTQCPSKSTDANSGNCCVYHVNVHSCPHDKLDASSLCGPWISPSGESFTHSDVMTGNVSRGVWKSSIAGLYEIGPVSLIAHFKIARIHLALHKQVTVQEAYSCDNGVCETSSGETCSNCPADCGACPLEVWQLALIAVAAVIAFALFLALIIYFVRQKQKMSALLWDESWVLNHEDIQQGQGLKFMGSAISMQQEATLSQSAQVKQIFTKTGIYEGRTYALKEIYKTKSFQLTKALREEVRSVRQVMNHQNLCKFAGACVKVPNVCVLSEYCPKGSLTDVLQNEEIPLNWAFRFSFCTDICRGMQALHDVKIYHGRLKTNNCVIDDRWTVKISDYGIQTLYKQDEDEEIADEENDEYYKRRAGRIFRAPELRDFPDAIPTVAGDIYSFAIILIEIAKRTDPYEDEDPDSITNDWRPSLPENNNDDPDNKCPCLAAYNKLIQQCWAAAPAERILFEEIKKILHRINPNKMSPVDLMMAMMEKYSKHLEVIVGERTQDLVAEKQKTDRLLYSMLPQAVADELRLGKDIKAQQYGSCTIYFSDIVGFTSISGGSTPFEVVALLNKLYTCFDSIIDKYDVYKVETIGDAYMVVSGVPKENGILHAREVACMSLDLVAECRTFVIPHMLKEPLKIRVGLHSGSVCAGVVGLKMPRYCLFGDTVNTASRMESNGEAYRIHLSEFTYAHLHNIGGFTCEKRGTIPIKGKGDMTTYWLTGKTLTIPSPVKELKKEAPKEFTSLDDNDESNSLPNVVVEPKTVAVINRKISSSNDSGYNEKYTTLDDSKITPEETHSNVSLISVREKAEETNGD